MNEIIKERVEKYFNSRGLNLPKGKRKITLPISGPGQHLMIEGKNLEEVKEKLEPYFDMDLASLLKAKEVIETKISLAVETVEDQLKRNLQRIEISYLLEGVHGKFEIESSRVREIKTYFNDKDSFYMNLSLDCEWQEEEIRRCFELTVEVPYEVAERDKAGITRFVKEWIFRAMKKRIDKAEKEMLEIKLLQEEIIGKAKTL